MQAGDLWGGLAAMLVAVPSAIAFGVTIFSPLGHEYAAQGAVAGILGATALGVFASLVGGAERLISSPCAPAAAVLAAFAVQAGATHTAPQLVILLMMLIAFAAGMIQIAFGALGIGRLIKYMPYPVVSGYLSGVGLIIILSQLPKLLGAPQGVVLSEVIRHPSTWRWEAIAVGAITALVMVVVPRLTKAVPAAILALIAGVLAYFAIALFEPALLRLQENALVVGQLAVSDVGFADALIGRVRMASRLQYENVAAVVVPAATLAVLLSIDTLKTCVVTDALTRSRHDSNRVLLGQGIGNAAAAAVGGMPGAGTMGGTLINLSSGGVSRVSGIVAGVLALLVYLALQGALQWLPIAALAAILIVIGVRMFDVHSLQFLRQRSTFLDFAVIVTVIAVAETVSLIAASAIGIGLAMLLFIREQIRGSILHRKSYGSHLFSKQMRLPEERVLLESHAERYVILELQGSLFFGTADQLYTLLEPELKTRSYVILDMRRVQSIDITAAHVLELMEEALRERKAYLIFSQLPKHLPSGQDMSGYFGEVGLVSPERYSRTFDELDAALEWVEDRILQEARLERVNESPLEVAEIELFRGRRAETVAGLAACMQTRSLKDGETLFRRGDAGEELFLIRKGAVRIMLPIQDGQAHHLATFGRGDFFGEMAFLDREPRSADAIAEGAVELYVLSRAQFDRFATEHKNLAINLLEGLARALAVRLRYTNSELRLLQAA
ncbi:MAG TPA: SulP family inorganic anion transporter [Burkholderiales bacterium]|nr:SulP family inorganic anion transporter [Burkholderiales bacterium]